MSASATACLTDSTAATGTASSAAVRSANARARWTDRPHTTMDSRSRTLLIARACVLACSP